jgi:hypothetical protein
MINLFIMLYNFMGFDLKQIFPIILDFFILSSNTTSLSFLGLSFGGYITINKLV